MNCTFDQSLGFPATCAECGRVVVSGIFPIYAACKARGGATLEDAITSAQIAMDRGPGTELHAILGSFGLRSSGDCKCDARIRYMNQMEAEQPGWCEANIDEIVGWLRESAAERGLPFFDAAGRMLVRRAIRNARRNATQ